MDMQAWAVLLLKENISVFAQKCKVAEHHIVMLFARLEIWILYLRQMLVGARQMLVGGGEIVCNSMRTQVDPENIQTPPAVYFTDSPCAYFLLL